MDIGAYAALKGYDAINAESHGESGSYTVILNRTKTIILDGREHTRSDGSSVITFQPDADGLYYAIRDGRVIGWVMTTEVTANANSDSGDKNDIKPYISENTLDFSAKTDIVTSKGTTDDGAPVGNQNAAGPHRRSHLSAADKEKYSERLIGLTTSAGTEVKAITGHAFDRIAERRISVSRIEDMIKNGKVSPDKTHPDRHVYDIPGSRMVLNYETGTIITVEWRNQNR